MSVSRDTTLNLIGVLLPLLVTLFTVPLYLQVVGLERYGLLALCWALLGYVGFLDLGIGAAVAQRVAKASGDDSSAMSILLGALRLSVAAGLTASVLIYFVSTTYFETSARIMSELGQEVAEAIPLVAALAPTVILSSAFAGLLQGRRRFMALNATSIIGSVAMSVLPLSAAYFHEPTLPFLLAGALVARVLGLLLLVIACCATLPRAALAATPAPIGALLRFGGWISLSSVTTPMLLGLDRLVIGAMLGAGAVATYSIPNGVVSRLSYISGSLASALFPRLSSAAEGERIRLFSISTVTVAVMLSPIAVTVVATVRPFLQIWIGEALAAAAEPIAYILILGAWVTGYVPLAVSRLQASGRPDLVAKVRIAQVIPYWLLLFGCIWLWGLAGAAIAFAFRATADLFLLFYFGRLEMRTLRILFSPACAILLSIFAAAFTNGLYRPIMLVLILVFIWIWSFRKAPDQVRLFIRPFLQPISRLRSKSLD